MKKIGLLGGTFNPVHNGHLIIASYLLNTSVVDEMWLVLSPLNPFKSSDQQIIEDAHRMNMLKITIDTYDDNRLKICDIELSMPRPSYSINTLEALKNIHTNYEFKWVIGSDNWDQFKSWKDWESILDNFGLIIYPRLHHDLNENPSLNIEIVNAPIIDISSTIIRNSLKKGYNMSYYLPDKVYKYIKINGLYK